MFENIGEMIVLLWRTLRALPQVFRQRQKAPGFYLPGDIVQKPGNRRLLRFSAVSRCQLPGQFHNG